MTNRIFNITRSPDLDELNTGGGDRVVIRPFSPVTDNTRDEPVGIGPLGNAVYSDLEFSAGRYQTREGTPMQFEGLKLQTLLMTISQQKKIVTTSCEGGMDGEIIEYVGQGSFQISIDCTIDGPNGVYPKEQVSRLHDVLVAPKAIDVVSWYLQQFDINSLVVIDFVVPQYAGRYSSQVFNINAISHTIIEATVKNA